MIFISALCVSILGIFVGTIGEFLALTELELLDKESLNYDFLPEAFMVNKTVYMILMWFTLLVCGFFMLPIFLLYYIQAKNFLNNRTTNERYSKKKPVIPKDKNEHRGSELSADSTGSSLLSAIQQLKMAEDILKEHGDPEDFGTKSCLSIRNQYAMCCRTTTPSQKGIYTDLIQNSNQEFHIDLEKSVNGLISSPDLELNDEGGSGSTRENDHEENTYNKQLSNISEETS